MPFHHALNQWNALWEKYQWHFVAGGILIILLAGIYFYDPFQWFAVPCPEVCTLSSAPAP